MFLKSLFLIAIVIIGVTPVFGETPTEYYNRLEAQRLGQYESAVNKYKSSTDRYKESVDNYLGVVRENAEAVRQRDAELNAREDNLVKRETAVRQAEERLVQRSFYYPYYDGYVVVNGWYPVWWVWPTWWHIGPVPYGYPIYGRVWVGWDHGRRSIVINNFATTVNHGNFRSDVLRAFNAPHAAPGFAGRHPAYKSWGGPHPHPGVWSHPGSPPGPRRLDGPPQVRPQPRMTPQVGVARPLPPHRPMLAPAPRMVPQYHRPAGPSAPAPRVQGGYRYR